jgi:hypothetical protein
VDAPAKVTVGRLLIVDGNITSTSPVSWGGAAIGAGYAWASGAVSSVGPLTIAGGNITAHGRAGAGGAGIGCGYGHNGGVSSVEELSILGGNITATALKGAAIGSGQSNTPIPRINILGGSFTLDSPYSGIGFGISRPDINLTIQKGYFDCGAISSGICLQATSLTFGQGSVNVITTTSTVVGSSQVRVSVSRPVLRVLDRISAGSINTGSTSSS